MRIPRSSGILLHPTSLPGPYGVGDLGHTAYRWLQFLADSGVQWWQMLPLGPTGYADSPYASFSAFAGNPMLVSPDLLREDGLLSAADLEDRPQFPTQAVDFGGVNAWKQSLLARAFAARGSHKRLLAAFEEFRQEKAGWLPDYSLFMAIKEAQGNGPWWRWPAALQQREPDALDGMRRSQAERIEEYAFQQFLFFRQWEALRERMAELGIQAIGDMPIYVARDSVDLWASPQLFDLDEGLNPTTVAGVPPDYFSETGQLWGNPL
ncbi:MAG TPA: 4-alpha-glucanotransferase, partial [Anaerolineales bacterium]